jgi:hypothetical protein
MRAMASVPPPAGNGTIILTGFCGQACAAAKPGARHTTASAANVVISFLIVLTLSFDPIVQRSPRPAPSSLPGLTRQSIALTSTLCFRWMRGSSPRMTS